jgi:putative ABC transport system permease protein
MLTGVLILIGSITLTKAQRIYEHAVLKTLGADRKTLAAMLLVEYGLLGLLAGLIGAGFATAMSFAVCRYLMEIRWEFDVVTAAAGLAATTIVVTAAGFLASFDVLFKRPLATLRSQ